jgi:hypothetical protein
MAGLEELRLDYKSTTGKAFRHFFCPVLQIDENVELCKGHIVNKGFPNVSRATVMQRKDVDNFYGIYFEEDFVKLQYEDTEIEDILSDDSLRRKLRPILSLDGEANEFYPIKKDNQDVSHSPLIFDHDPKKLFALKVDREDKDKLLAEGWEVSWEVNVTPTAIPSLIKAAHLTLFRMVGYRYALSTGGKLVGKGILGRFFLENRGQEAKTVRSNGETFFSSFKEMVRPVEVVGDWSFKGTLNDQLVLFCKDKQGVVWGMIVFVDIGTKIPLQVVVMPTEDHRNPAMSAVLFNRFLQGELRDFEISRCQFSKAGWLHETIWHPTHWRTG